MNQKVLNTLEYNKIIDQLVGLTSSKMAKEISMDLKPYYDLAYIRKKTARNIRSRNHDS